MPTLFSRSGDCGGAGRSEADKPGQCCKQAAPVRTESVCTLGRDLLHESGLVARELVGRGNSVLLFLYRSDAIASLLSRKSVSFILQKAGYANPADVETTLSELQSRLAGKSFPHETGVFLGYPLKDVIGFMGWAHLPFTCQGPWKMYGDPRQSLMLAEIHRQCRCMISQQLASIKNPLECLRLKSVGSCDGNLPSQDFFCHSIDKDIQYLRVQNVPHKEYNSSADGEPGTTPKGPKTLKKEISDDDAFRNFEPRRTRGNSRR